MPLYQAALCSSNQAQVSTSSQALGLNSSRAPFFRGPGRAGFLGRERPVSPPGAELPRVLKVTAHLPACPQHPSRPHARPPHRLPGWRDHPRPGPGCGVLFTPGMGASEKGGSGVLQQTGHRGSRPVQGDTSVLAPGRVGRLPFPVAGLIWQLFSESL